MSKATGMKGFTPDRLRRAADADTRRIAREERNDEQQLALLDARPGGAARERSRLVGVGGLTGVETD